MRITWFSFIPVFYWEGGERRKEKKSIFLDYTMMRKPGLADFPGTKNDYDFSQQCLFYVPFSVFFFKKRGSEELFMFFLPPLSPQGFSSSLQFVIKFQSVLCSTE